MGKNNFCGTLKVFKSIDNYRVDSSQYWEAIASSTVDAIDSMVIWNMKNVFAFQATFRTDAFKVHQEQQPLRFRRDVRWAIKMMKMIHTEWFILLVRKQAIGSFYLHESRYKLADAIYSPRTQAAPYGHRMDCIPIFAIECSILSHSCPR